MLLGLAPGENISYRMAPDAIGGKWVCSVIFYFWYYRFCSDSCMTLKLNEFDESIDAAGSPKPFGDELFFAYGYIYIPGIIIH